MPSDKITIERIALLHPKLRDEALAIYDEIVKALGNHVMCRFTATLRTFAEQDKIYAQGRTTKGSKVTNARGGQSYHNYGLALDIVLVLDKDKNGTFESAVWDVRGDFDKDGRADWMEIVNIFKQYGWKWGGDWKFYDAPHFQKTFGYSVRQLLDLHKAGKVDKNGYVLL
jgi:peptidoglycan L-alanyl-D-glutamate endopeptidase CwlK